MDKILTAALAAPIANLLIIGGLIFLGLGIVGRISGKIEPSNTSRVLSATLGAFLLVAGLGLHMLPAALSTGATGTAGPESAADMPAPETMAPTQLSPTLAPQTDTPPPSSPTPTPEAGTSPPPPPNPTPMPEAGASPPPSVTTESPPSGSKAGDTWTRPTDGAVMVYVPAGEFIMGTTAEDVDAILAECSSCDRASYSNEQPQHRVYLDAFWIDRTEVTNGRYLECVEAGACPEPECWGDEGYGEPKQPVVCVRWDDAQAYANWAGGRLPTEAEWEKAARGTDGLTYPWGNSFAGKRLNFCDRNCTKDGRDTKTNDSYARTAPVGKYPAGASPYGALDMAGNVCEWVADWYEPGYYDRSPGENPQGPGSGEGRVLRGGSYASGIRNVRCAHRLSVSPFVVGSDVGFRLVVDAGSPAP